MWSARWLLLLFFVAEGYVEITNDNCCKSTRICYRVIGKTGTHLNDGTRMRSMRFHDQERR